MTVAGGAARAGNPLSTGVPFREPQAHVGRQDSPPPPTVIQGARVATSHQTQKHQNTLYLLTAPRTATEARTDPPEPNLWKRPYG
jgi:hypothetical protein